MKYLKNSALIFLTVIMACCICSSCRNAGKYADDVWKAVDDKVDDIKSALKELRNKKPVRNAMDRVRCMMHIGMRMNVQSAGVMVKYYLTSLIC